MAAAANHQRLGDIAPHGDVQAQPIAGVLMHQRERPRQSLLTNGWLHGQDVGHPQSGHIEEDLARIGLHLPGKTPKQGGFSRSAFPHNAQHFAPMQVE